MNEGKMGDEIPNTLYHIENHINWLKDSQKNYDKDMVDKKN